MEGLFHVKHFSTSDCSFSFEKAKKMSAYRLIQYIGKCLDAKYRAKYQDHERFSFLKNLCRSLQELYVQKVTQCIKMGNIVYEDLFKEEKDFQPYIIIRRLEEWAALKLMNWIEKNPLLVHNWVRKHDKFQKFHSSKSFKMAFAVGRSGRVLRDAVNLYSSFKKIPNDENEKVAKNITDRRDYEILIREINRERKLGISW